MATNPLNPLKKLRQEAKRRHEQTSQIAESPETNLPPEVERIAGAVNPRFVPGPARIGYGGKPMIASVEEHEPHRVEINNPALFHQGERQLKGHEIVHLWRSNLPGPIQSKALPENLNDPYNISNIDQLRAKGYDLSTIPQEMAATIVQTYIAVPSERKRLQTWMDDMNKIPLSLVKPTAPNSPGLNTKARPPVPPIEAWTSLLGLKQEVAKRRAR
jgi:hypothetical protein